MDKFLVTGLGDQLKWAYAKTEATAQSMALIMLDSGAFFRVTIEHIQGEEGCLISDYKVARTLH